MMPSACTDVNLPGEFVKPDARLCLGSLQEGGMPRVIHFEIHADDPKRAMRFYHSVLAWDFTLIENMSVGYWGIKTGESEQPGIDGGLMRRLILWMARSLLPLFVRLRCPIWIST